MTTLSDLASLPTPAVIETLSFETIFSELQTEFQSRYPDYSALLASDPAVKLLEVAAYREVLLRNRINAAAKASLLAFATGSDLDHLAAFYGVTRLMAETDEALRLRTRQRIIGFANAGGAAHYRYWALSASPEVADVEVDSPEPGRVRISVLAKGEADTVPDAVLDAVRAVVLRDDIRVLTDTVEVVPAELIPVTVSARIWLYPDTPVAAFEAIVARFKEALAAQSGLGWDLTPSWLIGALQRPGVHKVELHSPTTDIRANANQAVRLMNLNLEFAGRDR
ncbi:baseplate assembly protein [Denitratisoma oestradiolicum]|uniref:Baseplate assembly protein J n=1 Tax=Denitratisoma oestradiolicum TaxID=311182 RepID=A0A6S6XYL0_9PROT|nr:baseplate J/gp47 family protein [Denitratisoma oestradiolicum]TWO80980.1 baseplate assembly protein J [Denitratisoma oestradiolicum]CAB1367243.1 Baseplate assembly protein J [Denitratisoma oestradiolicum]CAB1371151.1 Baseplate assembly protein J [Denitratisoma oestradiolicum]